MFRYISILLSTLWLSSFVSGQIEVDENGKPLFIYQWKIHGLSITKANSSAISAKFRMFVGVDLPCPGLGNGMMLLFSSCLFEIAASRVRFNETGLVCHGELKRTGNSTEWTTCDEFTKPPRPKAGVKVPEDMRQQLKWRIVDFKDGDYTAGSTRIYNSVSKAQSAPSKGLYSATLEILRREREEG
jgi:hypothetical protein